MSNLTKYFDKHEGRTVFIIGNSDELNSLTNEQISKLENEHVTIGVNYSHMVVSSNYMITGHMSHILYARDYGKVGTMFFQTAAPNPVFNGVPQVETIFCDYGNGSSITKHALKIEGCSNICISASHLAYLMGANRVVYLGFNQKNLLHFYDTNEELRETILSNISKVKTKLTNGSYPPSIMNKKDSILNDYVSHINHMLPVEQLTKSHWTSRPNNTNNINILTKMFNTMKSNGIEVISTLEDSIMTDSGATYKPIEEIL